jgi:hypothetical protein
MRRVSRRKPRSLCAEDIDVKWGKTLERVEYHRNGQEIIAYFEDGSSYQGNILVGCARPKSILREIAIGAELARNSSVGVVFNTAKVTYGDAEKAKHVRSAHPTNCLGYNPQGLFAYIISEYPVPVKVCHTNNGKFRMYRM